MPPVPLPPDFYRRNALEVAADLLNKVVVVGERSARLVEVEAYRGSDDPGSHGHRGPTPRTKVMFGPPGNLYVYLSYGVHHCMNVVCEPDGACAAVLLRAAEPLSDLEPLYRARPTARKPTDLCNGPGKLAQALGVDLAHNLGDVTTPGNPVVLVDDGVAPPTEPLVTPRIGLAEGKGETLPWRFVVPSSPWASRSAQV